MMGRGRNFLGRKAILTGAVLGAVATAVVVAAPAGAEPVEVGAGQEAAPNPFPGDAAVIGTAGLRLPWTETESHPVRFSVAAHGGVAESQGRFHVNHVQGDGSPFADFDGRVDCVLRDGDLTVITGIIERADVSELDVDLIGQRVGVSIREVPGGHDKIGWSWATGGFDGDALRCNGTVPFIATEWGDFSVR